jgi:hypothetical protein
MAIHLGRPLPNASCDRPERRRGRPARRAPALPATACRSYLVLLPVGFSLPPPLPEARCALTAPFHPCRPPECYSQTGTGLAVCFLWHFPWGRPRRALPGTVPPWSPDFPPLAKYKERPSDRLAWDDVGKRATEINNRAAGSAWHPGGTGAERQARTRARPRRGLRPRPPKTAKLPRFRTDREG